MALTTEYINGEWVLVNDPFKRYDTPAASSADYWRFLNDNPRYRGVLDSSNLDQAINMIGQSGYATDPNYARKLQGIDKNNPFVQARKKELINAGAPEHIATLGGLQSALETGYGKHVPGGNYYGIKDHSAINLPSAHAPTPTPTAPTEVAQNVLFSGQGAGMSPQEQLAMSMGPQAATPGTSLPLPQPDEGLSGLTMIQPPDTSYGLKARQFESEAANAINPLISALSGMDKMNLQATRGGRQPSPQYVNPFVAQLLGGI